MIAIPKLNLILAWAWLLGGFASGSVLGLYFHREDWLGGYASFPRRLYRLGHISFFGLGVVNFLFYFTVQSLALSAGPLTRAAGWAFILGALTMPACCVLVAGHREWKNIFALPVISLITGTCLLLWELFLC